MLQPARTKYRKQQKGRNTGIATRGNKVSFGEYGLKAIGRGRLTARQLEAARRTLSRHIKRGGRVWIRVFPDKPISRKPAEVRMGNGKGNPEYFVCEIQPGKIIFEMDGVDVRWRRKRSRWPRPSCRSGPRPYTGCWDKKDPPMKASELRAKNGDELQKELNELLKAQFGLRMQHATQQLANNSQIKKVRRGIARVRTVIRQKAAK